MLSGLLTRSLQEPELAVQVEGHGPRRRPAAFGAALPFLIKTEVFEGRAWKVRGTGRLTPPPPQAHAHASASGRADAAPTARSSRCQRPMGTHELTAGTGMEPSPRSHRRDPLHPTCTRVESPRAGTSPSPSACRTCDGHSARIYNPEPKASCRGCATRSSASPVTTGQRPPQTVWEGGHGGGWWPARKARGAGRNGQTDRTQRKKNQAEPGA